MSGMGRAMPDRQRTREDEAGHCSRATPPPAASGAIASRETVDGLRLIRQKMSGAGPWKEGGPVRGRLAALSAPRVKEPRGRAIIPSALSLIKRLYDYLLRRLPWGLDGDCQLS
jgi:hypothetical protein